MFAPIDEDKDLPGLHSAKSLLRVIGVPRKAKPEHIHRRANLQRVKPCFLLDQGMAAIGADGQSARIVNLRSLVFAVMPCSTMRPLASVLMKSPKPGRRLAPR